MNIWAIADLHLSFGIENKSMDVFGEHWKNHEEKVAYHWKQMIKEEDLVLLPGDHSWAHKFNDALVDLEWIASLPGTKVLSKGNHDPWWKSIKSMEEQAPNSLHFIHNNSFVFNDVAIAGTRLWDSPDVNFSSHIIFQDTPNVNVSEKDYSKDAIDHDAKIYKKEIARLKTSLESIPDHITKRICLVHYPPLGPNHHTNEVSDLLEKYKIHTCLYGHLHSLKLSAPVNFTKNNIHYYCCACDFINFQPIEVALESSSLPFQGR